MPYKCCFPGCRSNKYEGSEYVSVFRFPTNPLIRKQWAAAVPRDNYVPTKYSCVCLKHFNQSDLVTFLQNTEVPLHRQRPKLLPHAVPKQYPDEPAYFVRKTTTYSTKTEFLDEYQTDELDMSLSDLSYRQMIQNEINSDIIGSFDELKIYVQENNVRSDLNWQRTCTHDTVCFFIVNIEDRPYLEVSVKIYSDFSVVGWKGNVSIKRSILKKILGRDAKCDQYSKLHNMLGILRSRDSCQNLSIMKVENVASTTAIDEYDDDDDDVGYSPMVMCETIVLE